MRLAVRILVCLGICAWLAASTLSWRSALGGYERKFTPVLDLPGADKPLYLDNDCYVWIGYAQRMAVEGEWRIRRADFDNVPYGREMHWSQSIAWLEVLAGAVQSRATGEPWVDAIPRAAIWVNPAIFAACLCLLFCLLEARLGFLPAALAVAWLISQPNVVWSFHPYRPDHQSLHLLFALAALVFLLGGGAGWISDGPRRTRGFRWLAAVDLPDLQGARRWMIASGIAGGLALWIGATAEAICLGLLGAGALSAGLLFRPRDGEGPRFVPGLFRIWGRAGAATSLVMYAVEYLPGHASLRLEVNHPLYALCWLACAELLALLLRLRMEGRAPSKREWRAGILLACAAAVLPAVLFLGGAAVHVLRDPEMLRMHERIDEFGTYFHDAWLGGVLQNFLILPLVAPAALWLVFGGRLGAAQRWALWIGSVAVLGMLASMVVSQRWAAFYAVFSAALGAFALAAWLQSLAVQRRQVATLASAILLAIGAAMLFAQAQGRFAQLRAGGTFDEKLAQRILIKRFAVQLGARVKAGDARVMTESELGPAFDYFARVRSTSTLYWENLDGLRAAAEFFDAENDADARRIATERGLTHVLVPMNGKLADSFHFIRTGLPLPADSSSLASRLLRGTGVPSWLVRDASMDGVETCVFGGNRIVYPVAVWHVTPGP